MNGRIFIGLTTLVLGVTAQAHDRDYSDRYSHDRGRHGYAQVLDVDPVYERVRYTVPVERCWNEGREYSSRRSDGTDGAIVGGALGAVVGNNLGRNGNQAAATIGGALVGAIVGHEIAADDDHDRGRYRETRHCQVRHEERWDQRVVAYRVTYVHNGRRDVARLAYDPGRYVKLADVRRFG
jgi:uncharacterized protein YcfJ